LNYYVFPVFNNSVEKIGYAGSFTITTLPEELLQDVSYGLTIVNKNGQIIPGAASSWHISNDGKIYAFTLKNNLRLGNGEPFDPKTLPYTFKDVKKQINGNVVTFTLQSPYAPFLSVVSAPILIKNYGFNSFHISKIEENSGFIKSLTLTERSSNRKKVITFYPTQDALQTAFLLGEVSAMNDVSAQASPVSVFKSWKNVDVVRGVDYSEVITVFFNTLDPILSNKKVRQALAYALPESFPQGERSFYSIPPFSIYYLKSPNEGVLDLDLAKSLLSASGSTDITITIQTTEDLYPVAVQVAKAWEKLGIKSEIKTTGDIPSNFQALIFAMKVPKDPDMYTIWHSGQVNNITHYKNVRIDKLLEDGRQTTDSVNRIEIYANVQKYLLDDAPAAFLYFPYSYTVSKK
ncbi:MAG: ABC transporter substrate-binding protein, partial [Candidatus Levyibacteriota bacterium]